ncbi:hypothetical protein CYMTET_46699 [Cymbomonas tetramitiformis]|uniref:Transposase n=1 Tax=Cymbomonas tetramitiformis TaxID=36881 RepID=A0AAE0BXK5_9CHLO|nr:hypothetical protein CYMTET_46699 [Cymbomonas tetramitiformis]
MSRSSANITVVVPRGVRVVDAARAFLAGQYLSVALAARAFDLDSAQLVHYYVKKWKGTEVEDALVEVECLRAEEFLSGESELHTPRSDAAAALSEMLGHGVDDVQVSQAMGDGNALTSESNSGPSPLQPQNLSTQFGCEGSGLSDIAEAAHSLGAYEEGELPPLTNPCQSDRAKYVVSYKWAAQAVKDGVISSREASTRVLQKYGVQLRFSTICKAAAKLKVVTPEKPGRKSFIPPHAEKDLWEFICALRAMKVPVYKQTVCSYANELIAGTSIQDLFAHGVVDNNWYYGFFRSHGFT